VPLYEYVCLDCRERFDALRPIAQADVPIACRDCGSEHSSRTISVFYAQSGGRAVAGTHGGCSSCSGGHCSSCAN
jgi:putative FmdB family regulatory protein